MTVVLSLVCDDGVVAAADTQVTDRGRGVSYPAQKLHPLGTVAAWGGGGARGVLLGLKDAFDESAAAILEASDIGSALQSRALPVMRYHYQHFIEEVPASETTAGPAVHVLAAGYQEGRPWIVELNPNGLVSRYEEIGFHAVGSGAPMAQQAVALLAHFDMKERPVRYGVVAAVRVLDALSLTSPSVGGPLVVCRIDDAGACWLADDDIEEAREHAERWRALEQRALDDLFD